MLQKWHRRPWTVKQGTQFNHLSIRHSQNNTKGWGGSKRKLILLLLLSTPSVLEPSTQSKELRGKCPKRCSQVSLERGRDRLSAIFQKNQGFQAPFDSKRANKTLKKQFQNNHSSYHWVTYSKRKISMSKKWERYSVNNRLKRWKLKDWLNRGKIKIK